MRLIESLNDLLCNCLSMGESDTLTLITPNFGNRCDQNRYHRPRRTNIFKLTDQETNSHTDPHRYTVTDHLYSSIWLSNVHSPIAIQPLPPTDSNIRDTVPANVHISNRPKGDTNPATIKRNPWRAIVVASRGFSCWEEAQHRRGLARSKKTRMFEK